MIIQRTCEVIIASVICIFLILIFLELAMDETFQGLSEFQKQCRAEGGTHVVIEGQTLCFDSDLVKRFGEQE